MYASREQQVAATIAKINNLDEVGGVPAVLAGRLEALGAPARGMTPAYDRHAALNLG